MSVSGEQVSKVVEGDVVMESDGYMRLYLQNGSGVWFEYVVSPNGAMHSWVGEPKTKPFVSSGNKYVTNIRSLLIKLREEMRETST